MEALTPKELPKELREYLGKFDLNRCLACGTCSNGCPATGAPEMNGWNIRAALRMIALGRWQEVVDSNFPWVCTNCGRCAANCPMGLEIVPIMAHMRHLRPRDKVPGSVQKGVDFVVSSGNNMNISREDYLSSLADVGQELADEDCPGFYVPVDKPDADILFFPNSKEVFGDYEDMKFWWRIFYAARVNWTVPSENWESVDWGIFSANYEVNKLLAQRKIDHMKKLRSKRLVMPDCGGASYGCRVGMKKCVLEDPRNEVGFVYIYDLLLELIRDGRLTLTAEPNAGRRFTWHDSCKHGRELEVHFGKGYYEEPRFIIHQCVDDFKDMRPNRTMNYCCGAGGGNWPMPFEKQSAFHARYKYEQIMGTGADVVLVGCSNCRDQIRKRIPKFYEGCEYEVKYIWELVSDSLVMEPWSENEIARGEQEAAEQWEKLGVDLEAMEY